MKHLAFALCTLLTACSNISVSGKFNQKGELAEIGGRHEMTVSYKTEYGEFPVIVSARAIHDMEHLDKPINMATSFEIWFW